MMESFFRVVLVVALVVAHTGALRPARRTLVAYEEELSSGSTLRSGSLNVLNSTQRSVGGSSRCTSSCSSSSTSWHSCVSLSGSSRPLQQVADIEDLLRTGPPAEDLVRTAASSTQHPESDSDHQPEDCSGTTLLQVVRGGESPPSSKSSSCNGGSCRGGSENWNCTAAGDEGAGTGDADSGRGSSVDMGGEASDTEVRSTGAPAAVERPTNQESSTAALHGLEPHASVNVNIGQLALDSDEGEDAAVVGKESCTCSQLKREASPGDEGHQTPAAGDAAATPRIAATSRASESYNWKLVSGRGWVRMPSNESGNDEALVAAGTASPSSNQTGLQTANRHAGSSSRGTPIPLPAPPKIYSVPCAHSHPHPQQHHVRIETPTALQADLKRLLEQQRRKVDEDGATYCNVPRVASRLVGAGFLGAGKGAAPDSESEYETDYSDSEKEAAGAAADAQGESAASRAEVGATS